MSTQVEEAASPPPEAAEGEPSSLDTVLEAVRNAPGYVAGVALLAAVGVGYVYGPALAILTLAACALAGAIAMLWESLRAAFGETPLTPEEAFSIGAPSAEEEQKRAVLRAIKDLDFEHSVGKISDEDYRSYRARYRREAKRLLRLIDTKAAPERSKVEELVGRRLAAEGLAEADPRWEAEAEAEEKPKKKRKKRRKKKKKSEVAEVEPAASGNDTSSDDAEQAEEPAKKEESKVCASCETENDSDAGFCKKCGQPFNSEESE